MTTEHVSCLKYANTIPFFFSVGTLSIIIYSFILFSNLAVAVTIIEQQLANEDGGATMCGVRHHRLKHWPADDGCNECKCAKSTAAGDVDDKTVTVSPSALSCTNLWCGPATYDCLGGVVPCSGTNQVMSYALHKEKKTSIIIRIITIYTTIRIV